MSKGKWITGFLLSLIIICMGHPASAFGGDLIQNDRATVNKGQTVDNVVVFGNDATIKGHVRGSVIIIDGDLSIEKTAQIKDVVLVIGGDISQDKGAKVSDEVIDFKFGNGASLGFIIAGILLLTSWGLRLGFSLLFIVVVMITLLIMRNKTDNFERVVKERPLRVILIGAVSGVLLFVIGLLLSVTIIGIPVALLLFLFWLIFFFIGLSAASQMISRFIVRYEHRQPWLNGLFGALVLVGFINIPFLGCLLFIGILWLSTAYMTLWTLKKISFKSP